MTPLEKYPDAAKIRNDSIAYTIGIEGGYVNDPRDTGGKTRWGITEETARNFGWTGKMNQLPQEIAVEIYATEYWEKARCDKFSPSFAVRMFDAAVNHGPGGAGKIMQEAINVVRVWRPRKPAGGDLKVDGAVGPKTLRALHECYNYRRDKGQDFRPAFHLAFSEARDSYYLQCIAAAPEKVAFARGWEDRVDHMRKYASKLFFAYEAPDLLAPDSD